MRLAAPTPVPSAVKVLIVLLCIDIGNTNTVLATFDGDKLVHSWRIKTDGRSTADELGLMFRGLLAGPKGKLWAERFELDQFNGPAKLLARALGVDESKVKFPSEG